MTKILYLPSGNFLRFNGSDGYTNTEIVERVSRRESAIVLIEQLINPNSNISERWLKENNLIRPILRSELEIIYD